MAAIPLYGVDRVTFPRVGTAAQVAEALLKRAANSALTADHRLFIRSAGVPNALPRLGNLFRRGEVVVPSDAITARLDRHRAILGAYGIDDLATLGTLT